MKIVLGQRLGRGGDGSVYQVRDQAVIRGAGPRDGAKWARSFWRLQGVDEDTGDAVAIKLVEYGSDTNDVKEAMSVYKALCALRHPNLVTHRETTFLSPTRLQIVMELCEARSVGDAMRCACAPTPTFRWLTTARAAQCEGSHWMTSRSPSCCAAWRTACRSCIR